MQIRLLGAFAVDVDGRDVAARPWRLRKSRTLLKVLALAADQRMQRDRLLELLWPDRIPAAAANIALDGCAVATSGDKRNGFALGTRTFALLAATTHERVRSRRAGFLGVRRGRLGCGVGAHQAFSSLNRDEMVRNAKVATMIVPSTTTTPAAAASPYSNLRNMVR